MRQLPSEHCNKSFNWFVRRVTKTRRLIGIVTRPIGRQHKCGALEQSTGLAAAGIEMLRGVKLTL